ncbi:hypothetical protein [Leptotrichia wadei]|uniref:Uncharacterized protein n=1 Tax=Leptotrichia wadei (strain F0279) TaxID=888055 RepID=U2RBL0_LEPWF|nr:hypothetical protein [Leptotrichia wadei]ERK48117.1 hypothetical protein HMPREF9015_02051 [Leptotrichia wadei F0279]
MAIKYSKNEILEMIENAKFDIRSFYKQDFVNYAGKTKDSREYYTEIIAEWLLSHVDLFNKIKLINREGSYRIESHDGKIINQESNRAEEKIAMKLFDYSQNKGEIFDKIGKIIDYQIPLKNIQTDDAGKIDLLAYNEDTDTLRILELKKSDSKETMLKCLLEVYTYLKIVNKDKLLKDFGLPKNTIVKASPLVFFEGMQYMEMQEDRKNLKKLMEKMKIEPVYLIEENGKYKVKL